MTQSVTRVNERMRYELLVDGELAGYVDLRVKEGTTIAYHTQVLPEFGGRGLGGVLARGVLDDLAARPEPYRVTCPFLVGWVGKHPEYALARP